jgi:hypothetical protein
MNIRFLTVVFILLLILFPTKQQAFAKCVSAEYTIKGTVQDRSTRQAIPNATLFLFWDDYSSTISGGWKTNSDFSTTDINGIFVATGHFDTYSGPGFLVTDRCNKKPKKLTVIITASGYPTTRVIFNIKDLSLSGKESDRTVELPTIVLGYNTPAQLDRK